MALFQRLRSLDRDVLIWIDKLLRIIAVVVGLCALPIVFFVSLMAFDDPHPASHRYAIHLTEVLIAFDISGVLLAFIPRPDPPISKWQWVVFVALRLPPYALAAIGVGGPLWLAVRSVLR